MNYKFTFHSHPVQFQHLRYKPRQKKVDRTSVTVHKQIDEMMVQGPIPKRRPIRQYVLL